MAAELRPHRALLQRLYVDDDLSLAQVKAAMRRNFSINAAESTYHRLFREWGMKKNTKKENWKWVLHKRRELGGNGNLFVRGSMVSEKAVNRQISRHVLPSEQALIYAGVAGRPRTPEGFCFRNAEPQVLPLVEFEDIPCDKTPSNCSSSQSEHYDEVHAQHAVRMPAMRGVVTHQDRFGCWSQIEEQIVAHSSMPLGENDSGELAMLKETLKSCTFESWPRSIGNRDVTLDSLHHGVALLVGSSSGHRFGCPSPDYANCGFRCIVAAFSNDVELAEECATFYRPPVWRDQFRTALFIAIKRDHIMIVKTLLHMFASQPDPDLNLRNHMQQSCIHIAYATDNARILRYLLRKRSQRKYLSDVDSEGNTLFSIVANHMDGTGPSYQLWHGVMSLIHTAMQGSRLCAAIASGDIGQVRMLVRGGARLTYTDFWDTKRLRSNAPPKTWLEWEITEILRAARMEVYFKPEEASYVMDRNSWSCRCPGPCEEAVDERRCGVDHDMLDDMGVGVDAEEVASARQTMEARRGTILEVTSANPGETERERRARMGIAGLEMDLNALSVSNASRVLDEGSLSWNPKRMMHPWNNHTPSSGAQSISQWRFVSPTKQSSRRDFLQTAVLPSPDMPEMVP